MCKRKKKKRKKKKNFPISNSKQIKGGENEFFHFPLSSHFHEFKHARQTSFNFLFTFQINMWT